MIKSTQRWARLMRRYGWFWVGDGWQHKNGRHEKQRHAVKYKMVMDAPPPF